MATITTTEATELTDTSHVATRRRGMAKRAVHASIVALGLAGGLFTTAAHAAPLDSAPSGGPGDADAGAGGGVTPTGKANGAGPCTVATAATDCASGSCSPNAHVCIPAAGGCGIDAGACAPVVVATCDTGDAGGSTCTTGNGTCAVDADCIAGGHGEWCDTTAYKCRSAANVGAPPSDGHACPASGIDHACATGECNPTTDTCAAFNGAACSSAAACASNACDHGVCGYADGDGPCDPASGATSCQSGSSCSPSGVCLHAGECAKDTDCASGTFCDGATKSCAAPRANGQPYPAGAGTCGSHGTGPVDACQSGACNSATDTCGGANGSVCGTAADCASGVCGTNGLCGWADGAPGCTAATASACQSGTCDPSGACKPASHGSCTTDSECTDGHYCNHVTFSCTAAVGTGAAIPNDGAHGCSADSTSAACASGVCDAKSGSCVATNGDTCSADSECASGACGSDGKCGILTGAPTTCSGTSQCRTGYCDTGDGGAAAGTVCVSCEEDSQCGGAKFCNGVHECHALLQNAMKCSRGNECTSGVCADGICGGATQGSGVGSVGSDAGASTVASEPVSPSAGSTSESASDPVGGVQAGCSVSRTDSSSSSGAGFFFTAMGLGWAFSRRKKSAATSAR